MSTIGGALPDWSAQDAATTRRARSARSGWLALAQSARAAPGLLVSDLTTTEAFAEVVAQILGSRNLSEQSARRQLDQLEQFRRYLDGHGVDQFDQISPDHVLGFCREAVHRSGVWNEPAGNTQHHRLSAVRLLYRTARALRLTEGDPTRDVVLPPRGGTQKRPLTDEEQLAGMYASKQTLLDTRRPAAWALGQAGATASEIAAALVSDVDFAGGRVYLNGNSKRIPRWGPLDPWALDQIELRVDAIAHLGDQRLVYTGRREGTRAGGGWCSALREVFVAAGLAGRPGIYPDSLAAWAGRRAFDASGRIEDAARILGLRSLDDAARAIDWDWTA